MKEKTQLWAEMEARTRAFVLAAHMTAMNLDGRKGTVLNRIFNLGNPYIVIGEKPNGTRYCRVDAKSLKLMTLLIETYL